MRFSSLLIALLSASSLVACNGRGLVEVSEAGADAIDSIDAMPSDATSAQCPAIPFIVGSFERVYEPSNGRYLNDHTIVRGDDGIWHVYGITNAGAGMPQDEKRFLHATADSLFGPWTEHPDILIADPSLDEAVLWAPYVFRAASSQWTMLYWGGTLTDPSLRQLRQATSADLFNWQRLETHVDPTLRPPGGRDPFVLHTESGWLLYSVGAMALNGGVNGQILVSRSADPENPAGWTDPTVAIQDPVPNYSYGNLESPFVVSNECGYYLFLTRTDQADDSGYEHTLVFFSRDPMSFAWAPITEFHAHAAEIVTDEAGRQFVTSAGWPYYIGQSNRGLSIARLGWTAAQPAVDP